MEESLLMLVSLFL